MKRKLFLGATEPIMTENDRIYGKESTERRIWIGKESKTSVRKGEKKKRERGEEEKNQAGNGIFN